MDRSPIGVRCQQRIKILGRSRAKENGKILVAEILDVES